MKRHLDDYFSKFVPLEQPERGAHAIFLQGDKYKHRAAIIPEFKERLAEYYPGYSIKLSEEPGGLGQLYVEAKMVPRKRGELDTLM